MKLEVFILGEQRIDQKRKKGGTVERLWEMRKRRTEKIEKGSRERKRKREKREKRKRQKGVEKTI